MVVDKREKLHRKSEPEYNQRALENRRRLVKSSTIHVFNTHSFKTFEHVVRIRDVGSLGRLDEKLEGTSKLEREGLWNAPL